MKIFKPIQHPLGCFVACAVVLLISFEFCHFSSRIGADFDFRYNEVSAVRSGVDPYLIYSNQVQSDVFCSHRPLDPAQAKGKRKLDAYTPWSYSFLYPLSFFDEKTASRIFFFYNVGCSFFMLALALLLARQTGLDWERSVIAASGAFLTGISIPNCLGLQNYSIVLAAWLFLMVFALNSGRDYLAGLCWAVLMTKPQVAVLLFVPLLFQRKYTTILTAVAVCCLGAVPPAILCHTSPLILILDIAKSGMGIVESTLFFPTPVFKVIASFFGKQTALILSELLGLVICLFFAWRVRMSPRWEILLLPAVLCGMAWTYLRVQDQALMGLSQVVLIIAYFTIPAMKRMALLSIILSCASYILYFHDGFQSLLTISVRPLHALRPYLYGTERILTLAAFVSILSFLWLVSCPRSSTSIPKSA